ncbi:hypothetical protein PFISCL1PPCAC_27075 [Pristionchus fissidentatus]|uniref:ethanolamine kinase n=1 Tax=Pristionchus fissidentatus TaxID=1538716 RepID=A0AAV5WWU2_9BILA|nr:hypothetical protein PFISCL1PPCAC_27075 [Pristionchus fissidentatus]
MESLPLFDVSLPVEDITACKDIARILTCTIRKDWSIDQLEVEVFTNGITNKIFSICSKEDRTDRLVYRVFGHGTDRIIDRIKELEQWQKLASVGLAAKIIGRFHNGIVCEYLPGDPLLLQQLQWADVQHAIAEVMAKMHELTIGGVPCTFPKLNQFIENLQPTFGKNQEKYDEKFGSIDLRTLSSDLQKKIESLNARVVFCHNDLLIHNILIEDSGSNLPKNGSKTNGNSKSKVKLTFIDYEYADSNYELFDIANHFNEWAGVENVDYSMCPDETVKRKFLEYYYSFRTEEEKVDIDATLKQIPLFEAASHLFWTVWALVQSQNSTIKFDYLGYAASRFAQYKLKLSLYSQ